MYSVLPLISTHYSIGKSVIHCDKPKGNLTSYPVSCFDLIIQNKLDTLVVVDQSISGFMELNKNVIDAKVKLVYGLKIVVCQDIETKDDASLKTEAKYIIFIKNNDGYKNLIKISTVACTSGFYYRPRIDFKKLKELWSDKNLKLAVPFYDSFLHLNALESHLHVPDFSWTKPTFFIEDNDLPFDYLIKKRVDEYCAANQYETLRAQTILYPKKDDFVSWLCLKCISNRSSLDKPDLSHCGSDTFSFEHWQKLNNETQP